MVQATEATLEEQKEVPRRIWWGWGGGAHRIGELEWHKHARRAWEPSGPPDTLQPNSHPPPAQDSVLREPRVWLCP